MTWSRRGALRVGYYGGLSLLIVLILTKALPKVQAFGFGITAQVSENSEALVLALLLPLWIEIVRPRLAGKTMQWPVTLLATAGCAVLGTLLYRAEGALSGFKTLNETVLALAVLIPYVQLRRPLPRGTGFLAAAVVLGLIVVGEQNMLITRLAEALGMLILAALTFDVLDKALLDGGATTHLPVRAVWFVLLLVLPATFSLLNRSLDRGPGMEFLTYAVRTQESFVGMWLVGVYLALVSAPRCDAALQDHWSSPIPVQDRLTIERCTDAREPEA